MEFVHARRRNRTMERLTCVGGPVVYRTGIICPPAITRLNYSSRDEPGQTLHCFNRSPIIRQLLELQPINGIPGAEQSCLYTVHATRINAYKAAFHRSADAHWLFVANYASAPTNVSFVWLSSFDNCCAPKGIRISRSPDGLMASRRRTRLLREKARV